jgi:hypothetical protein
MSQQHHEDQPAHQVRCFTRAVKNARYLRRHDPASFGDERAPGLGTRLPAEILQRLHLLAPDAPELAPYPAVSEFLSRHPIPKVRRWTRIEGGQR